MGKREVLTIVKDWIHDLSYINMETDVEHIMESDEDRFKVYYLSSEFTISLTWITSGEITIFINHQFIGSIENGGEVIVEAGYDESKIKPLTSFDIRSLINRLKHPPTEEFKSFCKGVEEWLSHLNNSTFEWYWYSPTMNSIGKCYKVQVGPFERLFHIEKRDGGIMLDINYTPSIKYIDGLGVTLTTKPVAPFTFEEIINLRDTILSHMNHEDDKIKRIEEILLHWLSDMTMSYTRDGDHEYITCITQRGEFASTHAHIGVNVHEKNPCIWLYNTTNRIITFNPDKNWEPDMGLPYFNAYPFSHTNITKLMAMYVKEFCNGIDYEFRNTIFFTVEQWLKRKSHSDSNYHNLTLTRNSIDSIRWSISEGYYDLDWIDNKWRLSSIMFCTYKRICDITPNGDINIGMCVGSEEKSLINEIREAIKPDSTDEDLLASISKKYRTITDVLTDDFNKKEEYEEMRKFIDELKEIVEEDTVIISKSAADKLCRKSPAVINNASEIIEKAKLLNAFHPKVEVVKSRPHNFKTWAGMFSHRPVDEIRKDFKEAVNSIKPDTTIIDSMVVVPKVIKYRKEETKMNIPEIKHVLFNEVKKVTTVIFVDGTRVTSKATPDDEFDPEIGFSMCIMKKMYGNRVRFQKEIEKYHNAGAHRNKKIADKAARKAANAEKESEEEI